MIFTNLFSNRLHSEVAEKKGISNCPLCTLGNDVNKAKIWKLPEIDADHVTAWSKGGATDIKNCQMLCKTHNRAKGNK
jgi:5-methylcytosine-specific restriction endonuclease McrA